MPFSQLGLIPPLVKALADSQYAEPTAVQLQTIPAILDGKDVLAAAPTGTGKTASFVLPILQRFAGREAVRAKRVSALILSPTRELARQVQKDIDQYGRYLELTSLAMYGGVDSESQKQSLIQGVDILVATPGRLRDMLAQRALHFDALEVLVLDEADKMLAMGFHDDIQWIVNRLPRPYQSLLFSATLSKDVRSLAKTTVNQPLEITIEREQADKARLSQWLVTTDKDTKSALLSHMIKTLEWQQALIFIETKHGAAKLVTQLDKRGIKAESFHSGRSQASRERVLEDFKSGELKFLVATGIAARGLDIDGLPRVLNYDLPYDTDEFIHRIGRTARAGAKGEVVSLLSRDDFKNLCAIESRLGHIIERREIEGFSPRKEVPVSILNYKPKNKKTAAPAKRSRRQEPARRESKVNKSSSGKGGANAKSKPASKAKSFNPWGKS